MMRFLNDPDRNNMSKQKCALIGTVDPVGIYSVDKDGDYRVNPVDCCLLPCCDFPSVIKSSFVCKVSAIQIVYR